MKTREEALKILNEYVKSESLKKHCLAVAACMSAYAEKYNLSGEEINKYWICGVLHDFDWEIHPTLEKHPVEGVKILRSRGLDEEICIAILGHGNHTGVFRETLMAKTLFAVDELSGLVVALSKVRPGNFDGMTAKSVKRAMKKKDFAAAINREDILQGIAELGVEEDEHIDLIIKALYCVRGVLGFYEN